MGRDQCSLVAFPRRSSLGETTRLRECVLQRGRRCRQRSNVVQQLAELEEAKPGRRCCVSDRDALGMELRGRTQNINTDESSKKPHVSPGKKRIQRQGREPDEFHGLSNDRADGPQRGGWLCCDIRQRSTFWNCACKTQKMGHKR